MEMYSMSMNRR
ncbi:hypothetical protein D039_0940A, partial [Vibrio parahaemolyticus EKP-028]